jgi:hypothetical protein
MLKRHDNLSAASTLYSARPLNSRATTAVTPLEDFRTSHYTSPNNSEKRSDLKVASDKLSRESSQSHDFAPNGQYFSMPLKPDSEAVVTRKGTAKVLINRYESLSTTASRRPSMVCSNQQLSSATNQHHDEVQDEPDKGGKRRSPMRQSFRNLLSVFSRKAKPSRYPSIHVTDLLDMPEEACSQNGKFILPIPPPTPPPPRKLSVLEKTEKTPESILSPSKKVSGQVSCTTPLPIYEGELLYLCKPISIDGLPVWISCGVTLHHEHIILTWFSALNNPSTSLIQLEGCADVRSLSLGDLDAAESSLLPDGPTFREPKVFELLFEGKSREKFAAPSVKDRAGWVSAIWYII